MKKKENLNISKNLVEITSSDEKRGGGSFRYKLQELWRDKRSFKIRLVLSLLASLAFSFTFFVFGPYELYISNMSFLTFTFDKLILPMVICGIIMFAVPFAVLMLLRGKVFNCAMSSLFAVTICGYIQGNFINIDHGSLDGAAIDWAAFTLPTLFNMIIWLFIFAAVFMVLYFSRRIWTYMIEILSVVLIGAQTVALISLLFTTQFTVITDGGYLSNKDIYEVSGQKNVIFFLLDRFDKTFSSQIFEKNPEAKEKLSGFTFYNDFTGSYSRTYPSVNYLLTGVKCDYTMPTTEYVKNAWENGKFLPDIHNAGYNTKIYTEIQYTAFNAENLRGKVDNVGDITRTIDYSKMVEYMLNLSAYRYMPEAFKPSFWLYTGDLADIATLNDNSDSIHTTNDIKFYSDLRNNGVRITEEESKGAFIFYHLQGSHDPYVMGEFGQPVSYPTYGEGAYQQTMGNMNMIFDYIENLKKLGIYDDTTIIISADHGSTGTIPELDKQRLLSLYIKPSGADTSKPLQFSDKQICQDNLMASIISYFGLDSSSYGRTIEDIGEDEVTTRYFYMSGSDKERKHRDTNLVTYEIIGDGNDFSNWKIVSKDPIKYPYYDPHK